MSADAPARGPAGPHGQRRGPNDAMGSYPTEGANAQTRSEQNRIDCRMTLSSVNDEVTQWFFDDYMSAWIGVVSGVIAREQTSSWTIGQYPCITPPA